MQLYFGVVSSCGFEVSFASAWWGVTFRSLCVTASFAVEQVRVKYLPPSEVNFWNASSPSREGICRKPPTAGGIGHPPAGRATSGFHGIRFSVWDMPGRMLHPPVLFRSAPITEE